MEIHGNVWSREQTPYIYNYIMSTCTLKIILVEYRLVMGPYLSLHLYLIPSLNPHS